MSESSFSQLFIELKSEGVFLAVENIEEVLTKLEDKGPDIFLDKLSVWEKDYLNGLKIPKRIGDFLSGRFAAKKAVKEYLKSINYHENIHSSSIEIQRLESGEPAVFINGQSMDFLISITHSGNIAASIASGTADFCGIGIDMEKIEARDSSFFNIVFSDSEIERINNSGKDKRVTVYWAVKEALLKSMASGLNLNLKDIEVNETDSATVSVEIKGSVLETFNSLSGETPVVKQFKVDDYIISTSLIKRKH